jgi:hypothetical protein
MTPLVSVKQTPILRAACGVGRDAWYDALKDWGRIVEPEGYRGTRYKAIVVASKHEIFWHHAKGK